MAPLTWRDTAAPDFFSSLGALKLAGQDSTQAFSGLSDALGKFDEYAKGQNAAALMANLVKYQNPADLQAARANGSIFDGVNRNYLTADALKSVPGQAGTLLDQATSTEALRHAKVADPLLEAHQGDVNAQAAIQTAIDRATKGDKIRAASLANTETQARSGMYGAQADQARAGGRLSDANTVRVDQDTTQQGIVNTNTNLAYNAHEAARPYLVKMATSVQTRDDANRILSSPEVMRLPFSAQQELVEKANEILNGSVASGRAGSHISNAVSGGNGTGGGSAAPGAVDSIFSPVGPTTPATPASPTDIHPQLSSIVSPGGVKFSVATGAVPQFQGLLGDLEAAGYKINSGESGGYNPRNIAGTAIPSQHAYGHAIDINSKANAQGTAGEIPADLARSLAAKWGMTWGGDWGGKTRDPMHFEIKGAAAAPVPDTDAINAELKALQGRHTTVNSETIVRQGLMNAKINEDLATSGGSSYAETQADHSDPMTVVARLKKEIDLGVDPATQQHVTKPSPLADAETNVLLNAINHTMHLPGLDGHITAATAGSYVAAHMKSGDWWDRNMKYIIGGKGPIVPNQDAIDDTARAAAKGEIFHTESSAAANKALSGKLGEARDKLQDAITQLAAAIKTPAMADNIEAKRILVKQAQENYDTRLAAAAHKAYLPSWELKALEEKEKQDAADRLAADAKAGKAKPSPAADGSKGAAAEAIRTAAANNQPLPGPAAAKPDLSATMPLPGSVTGSAVPTTREDATPAPSIFQGRPSYFTQQARDSQFTNKPVGASLRGETAAAPAVAAPTAPTASLDQEAAAQAIREAVARKVNVSLPEKPPSAGAPVATLDTAIPAVAQAETAHANRATAILQQYAAERTAPPSKAQIRSGNAQDNNVNDILQKFAATHPAASTISDDQLTAASQEVESAEQAVKQAAQNLQAAQTRGDRNLSAYKAEARRAAMALQAAKQGHIFLSEVSSGQRAPH